MKNICVVGSLSSIFTHSYITSLLSNGFNVTIINTSTKLIFETYKGCDVLNLNELNNSALSNTSKSKLKDNKIFCYLYEVFLFFKAIFSSNSKIESFLKGKQLMYYVFFWGTSIRKEFYNIKKIHKKSDDQVKFILDVATYPIRDYAVNKTPKLLLWFDTVFFNSFDIVLSHSTVMDSFLTERLRVKKNIVKRFICSFPESSYYKNNIVRENNVLKKMIFLGTLDESSSINDISDEILQLAESGIEIHIQKSKASNFKHRNVKFFDPFSFEEIIDGKLSKFCVDFDGVLVAYGPMSKLREDLTYPTRYALALLQNIPIFIQANRFSSLSEIISQTSTSQIVFYNSIIDILSYTIKDYDVSGDVSDCMEKKISILFE